MLEKFLASTGLAAALAASTCCVMPLTLGAMGLGGAWLSSLSLLAPYQMTFQVLAVLLLGAAFWTVYGRRVPTADGSACAAVPTQRFAKSALWLGALAVALVLSFGWWQRLIN
jgi:mercuric ion transport protein